MIHTRTDEDTSPATARDVALAQEPAQSDPIVSAVQSRGLLSTVTDQQLTGFKRYIWEVLAPHRSNVPIVVPKHHELVDLVHATKRGQVDGQWSDSPRWRLYFGIRGESVQNRLRSIWHTIKGMNHPVPEKHQEAIAFIANVIVRVFEVAAIEQAERLAKVEIENGPAIRAQVVAQLLEALATFNTVLSTYTTVCKQVAHTHDLRRELDNLDRQARSELG